MMLLASANDMFLLNGLEDHLLPRQLMLAQQHAPERPRPNLLDLLKLAQVVAEPWLCRELFQNLYHARNGKRVSNENE